MSARVGATDPGTQPAAAPSQRVLVLDLRHDDGAVEPAAAAIRDLVAARLAARPGLRVLSSDDLRQYYELEQQRALLDCEADNGKCLAEIANAAGADLLVFGRVDRLNNEYRAQLTLFDARRVEARGRLLMRSERVEQLPDLVAANLDQLFGETPAPSSTRWLPWAGGGALGAAALCSAVALATGVLVNAQLDHPQQLTTAEYRDLQRNGLIAVGTGAGLAALLGIAGAALLIAAAFE